MQSFISQETGEITTDNIVSSESEQPPSGFTLPDMKVHDHRWTGFWRSLEKVAGNRYTAKCFYCNLELPSRPEKLHTHVLIATNITSSPSVSATKRQESLTNWYKPIPQDKHNKINKKLLDAVIYGNLSFNVVENLYLLDFLNEIAPNYDPPFADMLRVQVLNHSFSTYLARKFEVMESLTDITIALDGWQDMSKNSIYGFMALKENQEHVLEIINLSANRHTATFLKKQLK
ncbi:hypothetical protein C2G38_2195277 [Gigaspora rosea]|uniref:BED-type domain-containing protein n=1 Tax=Gigaspora rosea TaxID=44941 RepID=A0A397UVW8_9GLOM|nr:hypothetical protein C2G38_2195277 [Gigaspora rosea]